MVDLVEIGQSQVGLSEGTCHASGRELRRCLSAGAAISSRRAIFLGLRDASLLLCPFLAWPTITRCRSGFHGVKFDVEVDGSGSVRNGARLIEIRVVGLMRRARVWILNP